MEEGRKKAAEMLETMSDEERAGMKDLQNLKLAAGLPAAQSTLRFIVNASTVSEAEKKYALRVIDELYPNTNDIGCIKVDFYNRTINSPDIAYIMLDKCPRDHDFGKQLDKIKIHISPDEWPRITKCISFLIYSGRFIYQQVVKNNTDLLKRITSSNEYTEYKVDHDNTTLYIKSEWPYRIGVFIKLASDISLD